MKKKSSRYYHFTHGYHKWKSWCMIPEEHNRHIFFSFWTIFCPFIPPSRPKNPKNQNFAKMQRKNACRYHHFTQVYHKWQSHDIWWFLRYEAQQIFLSFWAIFCPFTQLTTQKIKILKKWKKKNTWRYHYFTQVELKIMIICFTVLEIWDMTDVIFIFHFELSFTLLQLSANSLIFLWEICLTYHFPTALTYSLPIVLDALSCIWFICTLVCLLQIKQAWLQGSPAKNLKTPQ